MSACKDCLCFDVCNDNYLTLPDLDVEKKCKRFKDESQVVEPPVNIGDTVYYIEGAYYRTTNLKVKSIKVTEINRKLNRSGKDLGWGFIAGNTRYKFSSLGKTVFSTPEAAEKRVKEITR